MPSDSSNSWSFSVVKKKIKNKEQYKNERTKMAKKANLEEEIRKYFLNEKIFSEQSCCQTSI